MHCNYTEFKFNSLNKQISNIKLKLNSKIDERIILIELACLVLVVFPTYRLVVFSLILLFILLLHDES